MIKSLGLKKASPMTLYKYAVKCDFGKKDGKHWTFDKSKITQWAMKHYANKEHEARSDFISINEAADKTGYSYTRLYQLAHEGELRFVMVGNGKGVMHVSAHDVQNLIERHKKFDHD